MYTSLFLGCFAFISFTAYSSSVVRISLTTVIYRTFSVAMNRLQECVFLEHYYYYFTMEGKGKEKKKRISIKKWKTRGVPLPSLFCSRHYPSKWMRVKAQLRTLNTQCVYCYYCCSFSQRLIKIIRSEWMRHDVYMYCNCVALVVWRCLPYIPYIPYISYIAQRGLYLSLALSISPAHCVCFSILGVTRIR